jgi:mannose-6-phosphate isomerase-like protein (cupin superfamily)
VSAAGASPTGSGAVVRLLADTGHGPTAGLVRRLLELPPGSHVADVAASTELWYVLSGSGQLSLPGQAELPDQAGRPDQPGQQSAQLGPDQGVLLPAGTRYRLTATGPAPMRLDAVTLPAASAAPPSGAGSQPASAGSQPSGSAAPVIRRLAECAVETTGDRRFRVLFGPDRDCPVATQFVGEIPPGRAPEHSHPYDEVVLIIDGEGIAHAGGMQQPLAPGSCIHLPPGVLHCLENTGPDTLRVLGVFHPADSPAAKLPPPGAALQSSAE